MTQNKNLPIRNKILSVQSRLVCGYVGSNIAELAIQLNGFDVIAFPSVLFATHTGISRIYGKTISKELFDELIAGIKVINVLKDVNNIITGYIGTADVIESLAEFIIEIKKEYTDRLYICDPVMGDFDQGMYVSEEVAEAIIKKLIPISDILTPNFYELKRLLNTDANTIDEILSRISNDSVLSTKRIIITGCILDDTKSNTIDILIIEGGNIERLSSPKIDIAMVGAGDLFTAVVSINMAKGKSLLESAKQAVDILHKSLVYAHQNNIKEMNSQCLLKSFELIK